MTIPELTEEETEKKWELVAKTLLQLHKSAKSCPEHMCVIVTWRDLVYVGSIQEIVPHFSKEIVLLSITSSPPPIGLVDAIRKLDTGWPELTADDALDLTGRLHVLRREESRLTRLTPDQSIYMLSHPISIRDG